MVFLITFFVTQLLRRYWTDSGDFGTNGQLSTMTRSYQGHFFRISTSGQISSGSFIAGNKYFEGCIFSKYFFRRKIFWEIAIVK